MVKSPWFRCFPGNFLLGTLGMRPILHKAYTRLVMGLYEAGGTLPHRRSALASLMEVRVQDVDRLLDELAGLGKISIEDGVIHNLRTDHEIMRNGVAAPVDEAVMGGPLPHDQRPSNGSGEGYVRSKMRASRARKAKQNYARAHDHAHDRTRAGAQPPPEAEAEGRALPLQAESPSLALTLKGAALPPRVADEPAAVASPSREGGLLPPPTPALLRSRIVAGDRANGHDGAVENADRGGAPDHPQPLPEPERAKPADAPAAGLLGVLARASRKGAQEP